MCYWKVSCFYFKQHKYLSLMVKLNLLFLFPNCSFCSFFLLSIKKYNHTWTRLVPRRKRTDQCSSRTIFFTGECFSDQFGLQQYWAIVAKKIARKKHQVEHILCQQQQPECFITFKFFCQQQTVGLSWVIKQSIQFRKCLPNDRLPFVGVFTQHCTRYRYLLRLRSLHTTKQFSRWFSTYLLASQPRRLHHAPHPNSLPSWFVLWSCFFYWNVMPGRDSWFQHWQQ